MSGFLGPTDPGPTGLLWNIDDRLQTALIKEIFHQITEVKNENKKADRAVQHYFTHRTYPIFVIFFTLTLFELWKFYTQKVLKFMSKLPRDKTTSVKFTHSLTECFDAYKIPNYV